MKCRSIRSELHLRISSSSQFPFKPGKMARFKFRLLFARAADTPVTKCETAPSATTVANIPSGGDSQLQRHHRHRCKNRPRVSRNFCVSARPLAPVPLISPDANVPAERGLVNSDRTQQTDENFIHVFFCVIKTAASVKFKSYGS